jgi:Spy/CpxP family protein refolding chaperone
LGADASRANVPFVQLQPTSAVTAAEVNALASLVLEEVNRSTKENLDAFMQRLHALERAKSALEALIERVAQESEEVAQSLRAIYDDLFVSTDFGEEEAFRLQMAMDRMSKMMETLSNILKKVSDTDSGIVQNLK